MAVEGGWIAGRAAGVDEVLHLLVALRLRVGWGVMRATAHRTVALMRIVVVGLALPAGLRIGVDGFAAGSIVEGTDGGGEKSEGG